MKIHIGDFQWWWDWRVMVPAPFCCLYDGLCEQVYAIVIGPITFSITLEWCDWDISYEHEVDGRWIAGMEDVFPGCLAYGKTLRQARRNVKRLAKKFTKGFAKHMKKVESNKAYMKHIEEVKAKYKEKGNG